MKPRVKKILFIILTIFLFAIAILIWANQNGKINIWNAKENNVNALNIDTLVSTGQNLWFNLIVAAILSGTFLWILSKKRPEY